MGLGGIITEIAKGAGKSLADSADKIIKDFVTDPTAKMQAQAELEKAKMSHEEAMAQIDVKAQEIDEKALESVNTTIQTEAKSEHWMVWAWRPFIGLVFGAAIFNNWILVPYFKMQVTVFDPQTMMVVGAILGVASIGRSATQWQREKNNG